MEMPKVQNWEHDNVKVRGLSTAGVGTSFLLPELNVCVDVAQGINFVIPAKHFLITHAHMDHAAGIPYIISQRALLKQNPPVFYMPESMVEPMKTILNAWGNLEGHQYKYEFIGVKPGEDYSLDNFHFFRPFATVHRVPSQGYTIFETRKKLKKEFANKTEVEIIKLRDQKIELSDKINLPAFSYTGDTQIEFWKKNPDVLKSKVLFMEVTYWDNKKNVDAAREWGHVHWQEVLPLIEEFEGEKLVFTHISSRYTREYVWSLIQKNVPTHLLSKVDLFY